MYSYSPEVLLDASDTSSQHTLYIGKLKQHKVYYKMPVKPQAAITRAMDK